jgi:hypothetical protein
MQVEAAVSLAMAVVNIIFGLITLFCCFRGKLNDRTMASPMTFLGILLLLAGTLDVAEISMKDVLDSWPGSAGLCFVWIYVHHYSVNLLGAATAFTSCLDLLTSFQLVPSPILLMEKHTLWSILLMCIGVNVLILPGLIYERFFVDDIVVSGCVWTAHSLVTSSFLATVICQWASLCMVAVTSVLITVDRNHLHWKGWMGAAINCLRILLASLYVASSFLVVFSLAYSTLDESESLPQPALIAYYIISAFQTLMILLDAFLQEIFVTP